MENENQKALSRQQQVAGYYDKYTKGYLETYGDTIQAFRPANTEDLHSYIINSAGIEDGMDLIDAGCGVAGPACFFASKKKVNISGITISPEQKRLADQRIDEHGMQEQVNVTLGDYHQLADHFDHNAFDMVLFLESLGHAKDASLVIEQVWDVLKPGGCIYIKDFFPFEIVDEAKAKRHQYVIERINESYTYNVLDLSDTTRKLREMGFEILFIKKFDFQDDITARFNFEEMFNIDLFGDMEEFRVAEWLEIKCRKPEFPMF